MFLVQRIKAWNLGLSDGFGPEGQGMTYYNDPEHPVSVAYDRGRNIGERLSGKFRGCEKPWGNRHWWQDTP